MTADGLDTPSPQPKMADTPDTAAGAIEAIEVKLILEAIYLRHGYDFRDYAQASMKRRLQMLQVRAGLPTLSHLQAQLLAASQLSPQQLAVLTVGTTTMFRDPGFFRTLREEVFPFLYSYPTLKIWHAGCSTGEEVWSLAIMLSEAGLLARTQIYATDINVQALDVARAGLYCGERLAQFEANYQAAGGTRRLSDYCERRREGLGPQLRFAQNFRDAVVFSEHNLVTDAVFAETNLILCRNVLIYFNRDLQQRVLSLFAASLRYKAFLCLGSQETVRFLDAGSEFADFAAEQRIFRKQNPGVWRPNWRTPPLPSFRGMT